ncbi:hypothetical protein K1719_020821 [Acacia pycnantha]|nr:hypothetical protein K1719_020821 [Acacia pycnantha]
MSSSENQKQISLTLVVDKKKQKVLYAEAGKDFLDVLLSFLTLPLGTISRLANENKEMLLNPRSPMDDFYKNQGWVGYDNTPFSKGFKGYLRVTTCYIVSDDLTVMPSKADTTLWMLRNFGLDCVTERLTVSVTQKEVPDLLKFSLWSKAPLTDLFLRKKLMQIHSSGTLELSKVKINEDQGKVGVRMKLKVVISKSERKVLFAEAQEDFIDQLLIFLTIPLAAVESLQRDNFGLGSIDNLYKSSSDLDNARDFDPFRLYLKDKLLNPLIAPRTNQLLPINSSGYSIGTYVRCGTRFMVKDDLSVEPFSSPAALSCLVESKVGERDLEEMDLSIGVNEVFGILKAAMMSTSALTIALRPLITVVEEGD